MTILSTENKDAQFVGKLHRLFAISRNHLAFENGNTRKPGVGGAAHGFGANGWDIDAQLLARFWPLDQDTTALHSGFAPVLGHAIEHGVGAFCGL